MTDDLLRSRGEGLFNLGVISIMDGAAYLTSQRAVAYLASAVSEQKRTLQLSERLVFPRSQQWQKQESFKQDRVLEKCCCYERDKSIGDRGKQETVVGVCQLPQRISGQDRKE